MTTIRNKTAEYVRRYWLGEAIGTATAIAGAYASRFFTDSNVASAYAATLGENLGFYGTMLAKDVLSDIRARNGDYRLADFRTTLGNLFLEFGPSEIVDSSAIRPAAMWAGMRFLPPWLGASAGKIIGDIVFYAGSASSRELRKKYTK